jgi:hypothetical protein
MHPPGNLGNFHKIAAQHITAASGKKNSVRDLTDNYATAGKQESSQLQVNNLGKNEGKVTN